MEEKEFIHQEIERSHFKIPDIIFKTPSTGLRDIYVENIINKQ